MAAEILALADAVTAALNGQTWTATGYEAVFNPPAVRRYVPVLNVADLQPGVLFVSVVPRSVAESLISRGRTLQGDYEIDVGFQQRFATPIDAQAQAQADNLAQLVEAAGDYLIRGNPNPLTGVTAMHLKNEPVYDPKRLDEVGEFLSVLTIRYRVFR